MQTLFGDAVLDIKYYWTLTTELDGIPVVISRTGWTGEVGYEIYLRDPSRGGELWDRIMEAGRPHDIRPIAPCEARRIEAGIFNYGSDMTIANNPFEIMGLERLVEPQDADYIGKAALEQIRARGVDRKLVGHRVRGRRAAVRDLAEARRAARRPDGRHRDRPHLVAAAQEEHRLRLGADRARRSPARPSRSRRPTAASGRRRPPRSRSSTRGRTPRSHDQPETPPPRRSPPDEIAAVRQPYRAASLLPGRAYHDPAIHDFERKEWFRRDWIVVGREEDAPSAGTYFTAEVDDEPLLIARGRDGELRAFYNVCRHRGTAVVEEPCGTAVRFQCPYHAWIYDLEGKLVRAKHTEDLEDFELRRSSASSRVRMETWQGFVFVCLSPETPPLVEWLGDLPPHLARFDFSGLRVAHTVTYEVDSNWKFIAENYSECYHCPGIHPQLNKLTPYDLGGDFAPTGPWQGGWMELVENAETMAIDGGHRNGRPAIAGMTPVDERRIYYYLIWPIDVHLDPPRLPARPPARAGRRRPHPDRLPVAVRARHDRDGRTSTRPTRSRSGT